MAELDAAARNKLPKSEFGQPAERKYPMPDKSHAADAKGRAAQMLKRGTISQAAYDKICAKADRVMGKKGGKASGKSEERGEGDKRGDSAREEADEVA